MDQVAQFIQANKALFEALQGISSLVTIVGWSVGAVLLLAAWRKGTISSFAVGPVNIRIKEAAMQAVTAAAQDFSAKSQEGDIDEKRIRTTVARAFDPETLDKLIGKSILWVDDNPINNMLVVRALKRMQLDVEEQPSTEAGLDALRRRRFDLVISDMGRGQNMVAGYELLKAIRDAGNQVPFLIFAGSDTPEFRTEAAARGAQLSTNNMLELMDNIILNLGR